MPFVFLAIGHEYLTKPSCLSRSTAPAPTQTSHILRLRLQTAAFVRARSLRAVRVPRLCFQGPVGRGLIAATLVAWLQSLQLSILSLSRHRHIPQVPIQNSTSFPLPKPRRAADFRPPAALGKSSQVRSTSKYSTGGLATASRTMAIP